MKFLPAIAVALLSIISPAWADGGKSELAALATDASADEMRFGRFDHTLLDPGRPAIAPRALFPGWHAMKKRLDEQHGVTFNLAYLALYQRASDTAFGSLAGTRELREIYDYLNLSPPTPWASKRGGRRDRRIQRQVDLHPPRHA